MTEEYQKQYWVEKRTTLLAKRKERYHNDPEYRAKVIATAKERYQRLRAQKPVVKRTVPKSVSDATRTLRPRAVMGAGGKLVMVQHMAELARRCMVSPETLKTWEQRGVIPPPTMLDEHGRRWYSPAYIESMIGLVEAHWNGVKDLGDFKKMVLAEFAKTGVK
jgi:DNA-binding transcriptional regulator YiaG